MRRAQSWTVDYTIGMLLFLMALGLSLGLIIQHFDEQEYETIIDDAQRLAEALVSTGYPTHWTENDVVRAGILSDGRLSWRKLAILERLNDSARSQALPTGYNYAFTIARNGTVLAVDDTCAIGNHPIPSTTDDNTTTHGLAYYTRTGGENALETWADNNNATAYEDQELVTLLGDAHKYGLIILEDPGLDERLNSTFSATLLREEFRQAAEYGPTIILTGSLGTPALGVNTTNGTNGTIGAHDEPYFLLNESDPINYTNAYELTFMPEEGGQLGNLDGATHKQAIAPGAATWLYEDSRAYYFASADGSYDGRTLTGVLEAGLDRILPRSTVDCTVDPASIDTPDLVRLERVVAGRGELYTLTLYAWRNP